VNFGDMGPKPEQQGAGAADPQHYDRTEDIQTRALIALLKDGMKPLDVHALDMRNQLHLFQSSVERYFRGIGIGDLDDHDQDHEQLRIQVVKSVMGLNAATALIGLPDSDLDTYKKIIDVLIDRFAPADDDVHSLGLVQQCSMRDDESTKAFVNRLRALVARMPTLDAAWQTKLILSALHLRHKSPKLRELLAEKVPDTVQAAEKIAEAYETRVKDKPIVDKLVGALAAPSGIQVDNMRARGTSAMGGNSSGRQVQCHTCQGYGHIAKVCPSAPRAQSSQPAGVPTGYNRFPQPSRTPRGRGPGLRGAQQGYGGFPRHGTPANAVGYAGYAEEAEQARFDEWQQLYAQEFAPYEEPLDAGSDFSGAVGA
jgi:hypothetical protein